MAKEVLMGIVRLWKFAFLVACLVACGGEREDTDQSTHACERVRDRLVDLRLADATGIDRKAHRETMRRAMGSDFVARCESSMTRSQIDCVLQAADAASARECTPH